MQSVASKSHFTTLTVYRGKGETRTISITSPDITRWHPLFLGTFFHPIVEKDHFLAQCKNIWVIAWFNDLHLKWLIFYKICYFLSFLATYCHQLQSGMVLEDRVQEWDECAFFPAFTNPQHDLKTWLKAFSSWHILTWNKNITFFFSLFLRKKHLERQWAALPRN